jgi:hypothetical protein
MRFRKEKRKEGIGVSLVRCVVLLGVLGAFVGCTPLPPGSLDPAAVLSPSRGKNGKASPLKSSKMVSTEVWVGRYQDSRHEGEIEFSLVRRAATLYGVWQLGTGEGGPVKASIWEDGETFAFRMENTAPECPGLYRGVGKLGKKAIFGHYQGKDCEGKVSDGRLNLELR